MDKPRLNELCQTHNLKHYNLFVEWFSLRFPQEQHASYVIEWIERFKGGEPTSHMDNESLKLYIECITKGRNLKEEERKFKEELRKEERTSKN